MITSFISMITSGNQSVRSPHFKIIRLLLLHSVYCNFTCFYAASTSRRIHAIALNKVCNLQVTSPAWCRLTYLQFAGEFTRGVIADCLQLQEILCRIAGFFACDCAGIFFCVCSYFCLRLAGIFTCDSSVFARKLHVFLPARHASLAGNFAC